MFYHYLMRSVRSLKQNWMYSLITLMCLSVGTVIFAMLIFSIDYDNLYKKNYKGSCMNATTIGKDSVHNASLYTYMLPQFSVPGVESVVAWYESNDEKHEKPLLTITDKYGKTSLFNPNTRYVNSEYYSFNNLTLLYGDRVPENKNEIIITESFLKRIGKDIDPFSLTIETELIIAGKGEVEENLQIVNVIKEDRWSFSQKKELFMSLDANYLGWCTAKVILAEGEDADVVKTRLESNVYMDHYGKSYAPSFFDMNSIIYTSLIKHSLLYLLASIILMTGVIGFLKHLLMMFRQQKKEINIRCCLGAGHRSLAILLLFDVIIMLMLVLFASLIISLFLIPFINTLEISDYYCYFPDIALIELLTLVFVFVISAVIVYFSVVKFKVDFFAVSNESVNRHLGRNVLIGIEVAVSVFVLSATLMLMVPSVSRPYNPLPRSVQKRVHTLDLSKEDSFSEYRNLIKNELRSNSHVESIIGLDQNIYDDGYLIWLSNADSSGTIKVISLYGDPEYFSFFNIPLDSLNSVDKSKSLYADRNLYETIEEKSIDINNITLSILAPYNSRIIDTSMKLVGVFEKRVGQMDATDGDNSLIDPILFIPDTEEASYLYVKFHAGVSTAHGERIIDEVIHHYIPETLDLDYGVKKSEQESSNRVIFTLLISAIVASILLVVLSVSSAITADTGSRRREVSIRKVHGAKGKDIAKMFLRPYSMIMLISFLIGYSIAFAIKSVIVSDMSNHISNVEKFSYFNWTLPVTFVGIALIIALSVFFKVRAIMRTNPAEIIKSE